MCDLHQINTALECLFHEERHWIVFWNDPEHEFAIILESLSLARVTIKMKSAEVARGPKSRTT
jgi:hypothetical protein